MIKFDKIQVPAGDKLVADANGKLLNAVVDAMFEMCPEISTPEW